MTRRRLPWQSAGLTASAVLAVSLGVAGCGAGAVRPRFVPFPQALVDTVPGDPEAVVERLTALLAGEGISVRWSKAVEGYVETRWFDAATKRERGANSLDTEAVVRLRFWADPDYLGGTVVVGEAVHRRVLDPSLPIRETEAPVSEDHPAAEILRRVMDALVSGEDNRAG